MSEVNQLRLHIGNISPKLKENSQLLNLRISKFCQEILSPLEFHTKPLELKYFAYITLQITRQNYEKLKQALNGVLFMGLKLTIALAKPISFQEKLSHSHSHSLSQHNMVNQRKLHDKEVKNNKIAKSRIDRILESQTKYPTNSITSTIRTSPFPFLHAIYSKSEHTFNNISATTKNQPPSRRLNGATSYGATVNSLIYKYRNGKSHAVIKGVHRRTPRKNPHLQTLRILINGELKMIKSFKTKLWGVEKNKSLRDLTWMFDSQVGWKSGEGHLVEAVEKSCGINGKQALLYGANTDKVDKVGNSSVSVPYNDEGDDDDEKKRNKAILASFLQKYDFDKPMGVEDYKDKEDEEETQIEVDSRGRKKVQHYDYEVEGKIENEEEDEEEDEEKDEKEKDAATQNNGVDFNQELCRPKAEVHYDEDDEGNDISDLDTIGKESPLSKPRGSALVQEEPDPGAPVAAKTQTTETLRSIFNPNTSLYSHDTIDNSQETTFKLALSDNDEDIDPTKTVLQQEQEMEQERLVKQIQQQQQKNLIEQQQNERKNQFGLFWPHFESPFLSTQSQLAKIGSVDDEFKFMSVVKGADTEIETEPYATNNNKANNKANDDVESAYEQWFWSVRDLDKRPKLTLMNVLWDIYNGCIALVIDPRATRITYPLIVCISSLLVKIVIYKVPYTEIDYSTYMQQIAKIEDYGEIDYLEIFGDSGPIVYPGGFVTIYSYLRWLIGDSIVDAQQIFGYIYVVCVLFACLIYSQVFDIAPWPIYLLLLSKRLVSIYVLRLFNDCWTTLAMLGTILLLQQAAALKKKTSSSSSSNGSSDSSSSSSSSNGSSDSSSWRDDWFDLSFFLSLVSADLYSIAISIKMNALLYLPAFVIIVYFLNDENLVKFLSIMAVIPLIQIVMGWKFLLPLYNDDKAKEIRWNYISQAFNFKRQFLYKWTVNWRFLSQEIFSSHAFAKILLIFHTVILLIFIFTRFLNSRVSGKSILQLFKDAFRPYSTISPNNVFNNRLVAPQLIFYIMSITNLIGVLCSRSLHYQFLSWYAWSLPGLLYLNFPVYLGLPIWLVHEWCWNVFPSTFLSSIVLVSVLSIVLIMSWFNFDKWFPSQQTLDEYNAWNQKQKQKKE
ncbi:ALG3 [Candida oxycetoniae]|uniref:Dol-P-Man:Man(5)GlcNAc(2)-PP-Dol alpha-1,3-mannosyltransferase n=1 Tax=Candida oxycetoniae TaxID=497107 RepID=A0AAI9SUG9_9ASCO|nr:ALG3 [Candida oxycetoniae]KAI3403063.2 ALG3 [Candida oxycetoniae]